MLGAEPAVAEGALHGWVWPAGLDAAQAGSVAGSDDAAVFEMGDEIIAAGAAGLSGADGFVVLEVVGVGGAEGPRAVLADLDCRLAAAGEEGADLADLRIGHDGGPGLDASIFAPGDRRVNAGARGRRLVRGRRGGWRWRARWRYRGR